MFRLQAVSEDDTIFYERTIVFFGASSLILREPYCYRLQGSLVASLVIYRSCVGSTGAVSFICYLISFVRVQSD